MPRVVKTRKPHEETNARYSKSLVRQCLSRPSRSSATTPVATTGCSSSQSVVDFRIAP